MSWVEKKKKVGFRRVISHREGTLPIALMFPGLFQFFHPAKHRQTNAHEPSTANVLADKLIEATVGRVPRPPPATHMAKVKGALCSYCAQLVCGKKWWSTGKKIRQNLLWTCIDWKHKTNCCAADIWQVFCPCSKGPQLFECQFQLLVSVREY